MFKKKFLPFKYVYIVSVQKNKTFRLENFLAYLTQAHPLAEGYHPFTS